MVNPRWFASSLLLCILWFIPAGAQQVYIRNQVFEGKVRTESGSLWVELEALQAALGFASVLEADGARVEGRLIRILRQGDVVFVPLAQAAAAVGAVVRENPPLGTVDVHLVVRPKSGLGLDIDIIEASKGLDSEEAQPDKVKGETVLTAGFSFVLPEEMQLSRDPRLVREFLLTHLPSLGSDVKLDALVFHKGDSKFQKGAAAFCWFESDVPKELEDEQLLIDVQLDFLHSLFESLKSEWTEPPKLMGASGQRFVMAMGVSRRPPHKGTAASMRIAPKRKRLYQVIATNIRPGDEASMLSFLRLLSTATTR